MIVKINRLPQISINTMSLAKIFAQELAFSGSPLENDFWMQKLNGKITALISFDSGSMNVWCQNPNYEELKDFISAIRPSVIFTEHKNAEPLGLICERIRNMLYKKCDGHSDLSVDFSLKELYNRLNEGCDVDIHLPSFDVFAPDVSHRLRHSAASATVSEIGAALCFKYKYGAVMSGIAVAKEQRGKGFGKNLLLSLLDSVNGDFFVAANENNTKFYLRNGFTLMDTVCFGKQEN